MFYWLRVPRDYSAFRGEQRIMAIARLYLSIWFFLVLFRADAYVLQFRETLLLLYFLYSVSVFIALRFRCGSSPFFHIGIHCADIVWAAYLALVIDWPGVSLVLFFIVLVSSKLRWGFWEAQLTTLSFIFLSVSGALLYPAGLPMHQGSFFEQILEGLLYCFVSLLIGFLAEPKVKRVEEGSIAALVASIRTGQDLEGAIQTFSSAIIPLFRATQIFVAIHDTSRNSSTLFRATNSSRDIQACELAPEQLPQYFFPAPAPSWRMESIRGSGTLQFRCLTLDSGKLASCRTNCGVPESFLSEHPLHLLLGVALQLGEGISVRVYVIEPASWFGGAEGLRFLERVARQAAPVVLNLFQVERVRKQAEAAAHGRVARELHDGAIQSLSAISLQIEELWSCAGPALTHEAGRLALIQKSIRDEIAALREFTTQLRSLGIDSGRLLGHLAQLAVKFQFDNDIAARFVSDVEDVRLQPRVCAEVARIAQEALVNVRKHSGANEVLLRFSRRNGNYVLGIVDNGRGFSFSGPRSHEDLQASGEGPAVIMDRAREIQASVSIDSVPGSGANIEIAIPINP
jgi:signal transduction histidine kinase